MKRQPTEWEKVFANDETKGINFQNIQTAHKLNIKKKKKKEKKTLKSDQKTEIGISPKRHTDGQQAHEKMLDITNY